MSSGVVTGYMTDANVEKMYSGGTDTNCHVEVPEPHEE